MTSQYFGSSSTHRHTRPVLSHAISVEPLPPNVSRTTALRFEELPMRYQSISTVFIVGWTSFFFGLSYSMTVVCERSANHPCAAPSRHP